MIYRPDLLSDESPDGLEVYQLTSERVPSCHVYMEAQVFTPDSQWFLLHRSARPHGSDSDDPEHRYLLCSPLTGEMFPVTNEVGATSPSVSPDGRFFYYFITQSGQYSNRLGEKVVLRRRRIDGSEPVDLLVLDGPIPGTRFRPSRLYPLSTISSDGKYLAISAFFGDGTREGAPWGLWVIDLESGHSHVPLAGPTWSNMHAQYCRSTDPEAKHDILVQEDHGALCAADGSRKRGDLRTHGIDIHVIRDDGQHLRSLPWGRDARERCQGHQCWRGDGRWAITSTLAFSMGDNRLSGELIESKAVPFIDHLGRKQEGLRSPLSCGVAGLEGGYLSHFSTDRSGRLLISDHLENINEWMADHSVIPRDALYLMALNSPGEGGVRQCAFLLRPRTSLSGGAHSHPFLSPDGQYAFFNSDESGVMQAYMIRQLPRIANYPPEAVGEAD